MTHDLTERVSGDSSVLLVLLYTDPDEAAGFVQCLSTEGGYEVITCPLSRPAERLIEELQPDLVLVEPPLEEGLLLAACEALRRMTERPIVVLSRQAEELTITRTLAAGIDEYLVLPINDSVLIARIGALARRMSRYRDGMVTTDFGGLVLSADDQSAELADKKVFLSPIEFRLLLCLTSARGKVATHDTLMSRVWGPEYVDSRHYLHLYIRYLREKLEADPKNPSIILSDWGIGYRIAPAESSVR